MRIFLKVTLPVLCWMSGIAACYAQTISLNRKGASLSEIFVDIHNQAGFYFYYDADALSRARPVDISVRNATISEVLPICFRDQPLTWTLTDKVITVREKDTAGKPASPESGFFGDVVDAAGAPIAGASIVVKGSPTGTASDDSGHFLLRGAKAGSILLVSHIGFRAAEFRTGEKTKLRIVLLPSENTLGDVSVEVSTGYQRMPKERATGSFVHISNELFNRSVSTNVVDRLDGVTSGLIFNKNFAPLVNQSAISIRGRSTIYSNPNPLVVVDNFPYDGDLSSLNPNDVESITILKDAAAASIWGAFSGNGVIVVTTKKGKYNQPVSISFNANATVQAKPDLWYQPRMSSSDYIDVTKFLFGKGYYDGAIGTSYGYLPPVADLMYQASTGAITQANADAQINAMRSQDVRQDIDRYFYRRAFNQQYAVNLSGGTRTDQYYFSAGLDRNLPSLTFTDVTRVTLTARNTYRLLRDRLEFFEGVVFSQTRQTNNNSGYIAPYPYARLAGSQGEALAINQYRQSYLDTAGEGLLLDWNNRPLDELRLADNSSRMTDYRVDAGLTYKILTGLEASLRYQFSHGETSAENYQSLQTYSTRALINSLSEIDFDDHSLLRPVPLGGIVDLSGSRYDAQNLRGQLNFDRVWGAHSVTAIAGAERRENETSARSYRLYGYDPAVQSSVPVDYADYFADYVYPYTYSAIPSNLSNLTTTSHYLSYFGNAAYTYRSTYTISGSFRRDESNLFGVNANQKGVPLWSTGLSWLISRERFYRVGFLPYLKLRATQGYNGNVNNNVSAYTTANVSPFPNYYNAVFETIVNPPNPDLRWERVHVVNLALDFRIRKDRLDGSFEYYWKSGQDLIGQRPLAPQTGVPLFTGNTADMRGHGFDLQLHSVNILAGRFSWETHLLVSRAVDIVSRFQATPGVAASYIDNTFLSPLQGRPLYSVYAYRYAGLDEKGNPQGVLDGKPSENYGVIENATDLSTLRFMGSANPTLFGSLRNTLTFSHFSLSFNIVFKAGYVFRRTSLDDYNLYIGNGDGQIDYGRRWQRAGDEKNTDVPALLYPSDYTRSNLYSGSDVLIEKGDHVRLQDIRCSYDFSRQANRWLPFASAKLFLYARNIGILWRANRQGIDPDVVPTYSSNSYPDPRSFSAGLTVQF